MESYSISSIFMLLLGWLGMILIILKIQNISVEESSSIMDPFEILGIEQSASPFVIKKAFRKLSLQHHPDHGGDSKKFIELSNAYQILTNKESRDKWEKYGNLDGPLELKYGIALPIWLISEKTPPTIIVLYYLSVLIGIPAIIYLTWRYIFPSKPQLKDGESVIGIFYQFFRESPLIPVKRLIIIISVCPIFNPDNSNRKKQHLSFFPYIKQLLTKMQITKEIMRPSPFNLTFSIEARALVWSQLYRFQIEPSSLIEYQRQTLTNYRGIIGMILHEFSSVWRYINYESMSRNQIPNTDFNSRLTTMENCIKLCSCLVQGLQVSDHNLLILPHITNTDIARLQQKKKNVKSVFDYIRLNPKLRQILSNELNNEQLSDIQYTLKALPFISMCVRIRSDCDTSNDQIVTNSLFNVDIIFQRKSLAVIMDENDKLMEINDKCISQNGITAAATTTTNTTSNDNELLKKPNKKTFKKKKSHKLTHNTSNSHVVEEVTCDNTQDLHYQNDNTCMDFPPYKSIKQLNDKKHLKNSPNILAHCPLFHNNIPESWWIYITLDNDNSYVPTIHRTDCIYDGYTCYVQTDAPPLPGTYSYTLNVVSDVYLGFHFKQKFIVKVTNETPIDMTHHWDISSSGSDIDISILTDEEVPISDNELELS